MQCSAKIECALATWYCQMTADHPGPHLPFISWPHLQEIADYIEQLEARMLQARIAYDFIQGWSAKQAEEDMLEALSGVRFSKPSREGTDR